MDRVISALNRLAEIRSYIDITNMKYDSERDTLLEPLRVELAQIESARSEEINELQYQASIIEESIKNEVLAIGASVKGELLSAVWSKPRVSWDTKKLDGYAAAHPEITAFRNVGEPSVSIRNNR